VNIYALISLAVVFGLLIWWLFLVLSGLRKEEEMRKDLPAKCPAQRRPKNLANSLISKVVPEDQ
jgi:hypothetical protein